VSDVLRRPAFILAFSVVPASIAPAADWPEWRGPDRRGIWKDVALPAKLSPDRVRPRWKVPVGGGYSGIAVVGKRIYTMDRPPGPPARERVVALDRESGRTLWSHEYAAEYGDLDYGNGPRSTPTVHGGRVFTLGTVGHVHALDAESGEVIWRVDAVRSLDARIPTWGHAASPLIADGLVILQVGARPAGTVVAFDASSGMERWRALDDRPGYSSPIVVQDPARHEIVAWTADSVAGMAPATGALLSTVPFKSTYDVAIISPVYHDGLLLVSGYWEGSKAIRLAEGKPPEVRWGGKTLSCLMSTPLLRDGHLYALDKDEGLFCIEWGTGKVLWKDGHRVTPKARNPQAFLVWAGERAAILNELGELILARLSPQGYAEEGRASIVGKTWAPPAFSGQDVFARNDTELVRVEILPGG
jgi:outer membrane protein assembly factor BamB